MEQKNLKKLSRIQLASRLVSVMEENERLKKELDQAKEELARRELISQQSGTLAEAAMQLSGIFEAADNAARIYLENLKREGEKGGMP